MKSNIKALPKISFDLSGVLTLNKSFATGETIFSQGDSAETLMYIKKAVSYTHLTLPTIYSV